MTKLTPQELDERIATKVSQWFGEPVPVVEDDIKQLIRDCIEAVTPEHRKGIELLQDSKDGEEYWSCRECGGYDECDCSGFEEAIDTIQANTKELLG